MLPKNGIFVKQVERMVSECSLAKRVAFCLLHRQRPDCCIFVLDETRKTGPAMVCWFCSAPIGQPLEVRAQAQRARGRYSSALIIPDAAQIVELFSTKCPRLRTVPAWRFIVRVRKIAV